jgi:hypothetical protein
METAMSKGSSKDQSVSPTGAKAKPREKELSQAELDQVAGGKTTLSDIPITKKYDKSSTSL